MKQTIKNIPTRTTPEDNSKLRQLANSRLEDKEHYAMRLKTYCQTLQQEVRDLNNDKAYFIRELNNTREEILRQDDTIKQLHKKIKDLLFLISTYK